MKKYSFESGQESVQKSILAKPDSLNLKRLFLKSGLELLTFLEQSAIQTFPNAFSTRFVEQVSTHYPFSS
jgi:hypothetical protein